MLMNSPVRTHRSKQYTWLPPERVGGAIHIHLHIKMKQKNSGVLRTTQIVDVSFMAVMGGPTDRKMSERRGPLPSGVCSSIRESSRGRSGACVGDSAKPFKGGAAIRPELFIRTNWIGHRQRDVRLSRPVTMSVAPLRRAEFAAEKC